MDKNVKIFLEKLKETPNFRKVKFVFYYGSRISGIATNLSDFDFCIFYDGDSQERFEFLIKLGSKLSDDFDIHIFQDLPLFVRKEVLKGKLIYCKDEDFVYDKARETINEFEDFKKRYYDYIGLEKMK